MFVKRALERERHILTNFLTEVYISLDEIEKLMLDEPSLGNVCNIESSTNGKGISHKNSSPGAEKYTVYFNRNSMVFGSFEKLFG
ncbi:hypothetical protein TNCT_353941 [Trichonephila clavata]|uniref:Uncharacterized protein n=1 Tax=Trichonephila clavata TaxID=2740835 RepID=A0A8X6L2R1_TRICU|nr:hypothetical protein TNCT_23711 [Trichonephila clavata]GFQ95071.1 hypothetical protein TNCT_353941 [Trichonephila clavata]